MVPALVLFLLAVMQHTHGQVDEPKKREALQINAENECLQKYLNATNVLPDIVYQQAKTVFDRFRLQGYEEVCTSETVDGITNTTVLSLLQNLESYGWIDYGTAYTIVSSFQSKGPAYYVSKLSVNTYKNEIAFCWFGRCRDPLDNTTMCFLYSCCKFKLNGPTAYDSDNRVLLYNNTRLAVEENDLVWKYMKQQVVTQFKEDQSQFIDAFYNDGLSLRSYLSVEVQQCLKYIEDNPEKKAFVFCTLANVTVQVDS